MSKYVKPTIEHNPDKYRVGRREGRDGGTSNPRYSEVDAEELRHFVDMVVEYGGCVILSRSSDGGVLAVTVISGNARTRAYPRTADDCIRSFHDILDEFGI